MAVAQALPKVVAAAVVVPQAVTLPLPVAPRLLLLAAVTAAAGATEVVLAVDPVALVAVVVVTGPVDLVQQGKVTRAAIGAQEVYQQVAVVAAVLARLVPLEAAPAVLDCPPQ